MTEIITGNRAVMLPEGLASCWGCVRMIAVFSNLPVRRSILLLRDRLIGLQVHWWERKNALQPPIVRNHTFMRDHHHAVLHFGSVVEKLLKLAAIARCLQIAEALKMQNIKLPKVAGLNYKLCSKTHKKVH